jgi:hypothetical protein
MRVLCRNFLGFEVDSSRSYAKEMRVEFEAVDLSVVATGCDEGKAKVLRKARRG